MVHSLEMASDVRSAWEVHLASARAHGAERRDRETSVVV